MCLLLKFVADLDSAGTKDSALTVHGSLQADRLGQHLASIPLRVSHIYSSDLQRACKTAEAIRFAQKNQDRVSSPQVTQLCLLREQDFGFYEGKPFYTRVGESNKTGKESHRLEHLGDPAFKDVESKESMALRMNSFLEGHLIPLLMDKDRSEEPIVAIVSHGIILSVLWRCLLKLFIPWTVQFAPEVAIGSGSMSLEYLGGWSNTGYLELDILDEDVDTATVQRFDSERKGSVQNDKPSASHLLLSGRIMVIKTVNGKGHLKGLRRTGGGLGSSQFDEGQQKIETFFKKRKLG